MTTVDLEEVASLDINCEACNRSNSLLEAARRDTKFEFEFAAAHWVCITKALTSSLNSMQKAAEKSEAVNNVVKSEIWHHKHLLRKINNVIKDDDGYVKSSHKDCLKTIDRWLIEYSEC